MGPDGGTGSDDGIITFNTSQNVNTGGTLVERARFSSNGALRLTNHIYINGELGLSLKNSIGGPDNAARVFACVGTTGANVSKGGAIGAIDNRTPHNHDFPSGTVSAAFSTYSGTSTSSPYADMLVLNTYTDSSGGSTNAIIVSKSSNFVKLSKANYLNGQEFSSGSISTFNLTSASDQSVKENINEIDQALQKIKSLRPVTFEWTDEYIQSGLSKNDAENIFDEESERIMPEEKVTNVGLIAQEVEEVIPTVVHDGRISLNGTEDGLKNIDYEKLIPHMIKAIQELSQKVEELENK